MDLYCWQCVVEQEPDLYNTLTRVNRQLSQLRPIPTIEQSANTIKYTVNNVLHRKDGPAHIIAPLFEYWWYKGRMHRENGPAYRGPSTEDWYHHGQLHRNGGPARITPNCEQWFQYGKLHRDEDEAAFIGKDYKEWYQHGKLIKREGRERPNYFNTETKQWY